MRKVKNITVCVAPEVYREARILAAEYDTTVSAFVAWLLPRMRMAVQRTYFPKGGPKPCTQPSPALNVLVTPPTPLPPTPLPLILDRSQGQTPVCGCLTTGGESAKTGRETVPATLTNEESAACSHTAAPVQPLCNCTEAVTST
jgi:hypothetical protein